MCFFSSCQICIPIIFKFKKNVFSKSDCRHLGTDQRGEITIYSTVGSTLFNVKCTLYNTIWRANRLCLVKVCWVHCGIKRETRAAFLELWVGIFYFTEHDILFTVPYILYTVQLAGYSEHCNL